MTPPKLLVGLTAGALLFGAIALSRMPNRTAQARPGTDKPPRVASPAAVRMVHAARALLDGLSPELRRKAQRDHDDPKRFVWHYYPRVAWERTGVMLKDLTPPQKELFRELVRAGTSETGFETAMNLMQLEAILRDIENTPFARKFRDPERFYITIFGKPARTGRWSWKLEGHHLLLHYVLEEGRIVSATPFVFGANPGRVPSGPRRDWRILPRQEDLGRQLYTSLGAAARQQATIAAQPPFDVLTNADVTPQRLPLIGLAYSKMTGEQQELLQEILKVYLGLMPKEVQDRLLADIAEAGMDRIHFGWAGAPQPGKPHYYRLNGPTFLIEYCNTQNGGNHIHVVWRDYGNDFGRTAASR